MDALTGLFNHNAFYKLLEEQIETAAECDQELVLAILDIDDFKSINDTFGHTRGDCVLRELATIMKELENEHTIPARYGGEEFCVLFTNDTLSQAENRMDVLRQRFENLRIEEIQQHQVTFSAGIAAYKNKYHTSTVMINAADEALYMAKRSGKNRVVVYQRD